jgi:DNA-binding NarL/FixJ family response regulator
LKCYRHHLDLQQNTIGEPGAGAIADALVISEGAVEKHVANIFAKLDLPVSENDHRRVLAVLRFLES